MFKILIIFISLSTILLTGLIINAKISDGQNSPKFDSSQYEKVGDVALPNKIELPTVFKVDKSKATGNQKDDLIIVDQDDKPAEMYTKFTDVSSYSPNLQIKALSPIKQFEGFMIDKFPRTFTEFDLDKDSGKASFEIDFGETKYLEGLQISFASNTTNPEFIEIMGENLSNQFTIIAKSSFTSYLNYFPPIKASKITINLFHSQVLRINDIRPQFGLGMSKEQAQNEWFFLAVPNNQYKAFVLQNDRFPNGWKTLDLNLGYEIKEAGVGELKLNPEFISKDTDKDSVKDLQDNCPLVHNPNQIDKDQNSTGDDCEDRDIDGVIDAKDNCLLIANFNQLDSDSDKFGDACDSIDDRFLEMNAWVVPVIIMVCSILVLLVFASRLKNINN